KNKASWASPGHLRPNAALSAGTGGLSTPTVSHYVNDYVVVVFGPHWNTGILQPRRLVQGDRPVDGDRRRGRQAVLERLQPGAGGAGRSASASSGGGELAEGPRCFTPRSPAPLCRLVSPDP